MNGMTKIIEVQYSTARVSKRRLDAENNRLEKKHPLAYARGTVPGVSACLRARYCTRRLRLLTRAVLYQAPLLAYARGTVPGVSACLRALYCAKRLCLLTLAGLFNPLTHGE